MRLQYNYDSLRLVTTRLRYYYDYLILQYRSALRTAFHVTGLEPDLVLIGFFVLIFLRYDRRV